MRKKSVATSVMALALAASVFAGGAGAAFAKEAPLSTYTKGKTADKAAAPKVEAPKVEAPKAEAPEAKKAEAPDVKKAEAPEVKANEPAHVEGAEGTL